MWLCWNRGIHLLYRLLLSYNGCNCKATVYGYLRLRKKKNYIFSKGAHLLSKQTTAHLKSRLLKTPGLFSLGLRFYQQLRFLFFPFAIFSFSLLPNSFTLLLFINSFGLFVCFPLQALPFTNRFVLFVSLYEEFCFLCVS